MTDTEIRDSLMGMQNDIRNIVRLANQMTRGLWIEVTSNFNGQPYGYSLPSLHGKQFKVRSCWMDGYSISFLIGNYHVAIPIGEIRFLQTEPKV